MATYGTLLIDSGGGVIDHKKQSDRQPGATVIIGLGGTGTDAVIKLKGEVYKQLKPDDVNAVIPEYKEIKYLIIDSDNAKIEAGNGKISDINKNTEYFSISNKSIKTVFAAKEVMQNRHELDWLDYENISIDDASAGAGGIRQVGRFLLVDKAQSLYARIISTIHSALIGSSGKLTIHICSGISGGTGSGTFLDVCYLVRQALQDLGKMDANVCGYFFLPDVNLSVPAISADPLKSNFVSVNGFAALKELDYCMNFGKNKDSFKMNYGFMKIKNAQKPVDLCYLISTTNEQGKMVSNGYDYAMGVVTDFIISFLAKVQLPADVTADTKGITLDGHISNLNTIRSGIKLQHGANVDYNILGASVAEMPLSEIATYLGFKLFESYTEMYEKIPTEKERDNFLQSNQLKYEDIKKELSKNCAEQINFPKWLDAKLFKTQGNAKFVQFAEEYLANNKGELEKNSKTFLAEMKDYIIPDKSTSLISRTYKGLCQQYLTQLSYGPFFAQRMLYGTQNQNLIHAVDGFIGQNTVKLEAELRQSKLRNEEYEDALARMQKTNVFNAGGRISDYLNALNNLYVHLYKVEMLQTMNIILQGYKKQLIKLDNNFFNILTTVLDTLKETFKANGSVLTEGVRTENTYNWKILSIPEVKESLDEEVRKLDLQNTLYDLMTMMLENCAKWIATNENEIKKLISDFVLKAFGEATQKTITDYLKVKYMVDNITLLAQKIEKNIIQNKLDVDSTPLFWKNPMYQNAVGMNSTLTVPYDSAEIKQAAYSYAGNKQEFLVRESGITDKISMMRFYSGLPMYAYQGILQLQDKYERDSKPGRHLYECGTVNWNEWLPSPIPASFKIGMPFERIENRNKVLIEEFNNALQLRVVVQNTFGNWEIQITEDFNVNDYIENAGGYKTNGKININKLSTLINSLEQEIQKQENNVKLIQIQTLKANEGSEYQVMLDFYLESPVLNQILKNELNKRKQINEKIAELKELKQNAEVEGKEKKDFFNAIFTGVISYENTITYTYDDFGIERVVVLQNNEMEFGNTGAYQAFLTYRDTLDKNIKKEIVTISKKRMDNASKCPEAQEAVKKLDANMQKRIRYNLSQNETEPLHEELDKFYGEFMKALQIFKLSM